MNREMKSAFDQIHAETELKEQTQKYVFEKMQRQKRSYSYRRIAVVMACFFFVLLGTGGSVSFFTQTSAISIDVNPSLELGINRFDRVLSIKGYNDDGRAVASALNIRFLKYTDAVKRILEDESMEAYLAKDSEVSITVLGKTAEKQEEMLTKVSSCTASLHENVQCSHGNKEEVSKAHEAGVSFGKYKAFLELQKIKPEITVEDIENLSMHEIHEMMTEKEEHNETHGKHKKSEKRSEEGPEEKLEDKSEDKEIESHHNHEKEKVEKKSHHKEK